ncbi:hypothetical protein [Psychrobacillus sp. FSL K6-2843]|uniref:hypothetical protein n=1 Tax=Psychrobacillus sp. FSL K6-2843 TaxID=2921549 RepID=UPI00315AAC96
MTYDGYNYDLSGKAQAGQTVKVYRTVDGVSTRDLVGKTTADSSGNWTIKAVNLAQDKANKFEAWSFAPGKDSATPWATNSGAESYGSTVINEGAFASTQIKATDNGDNGLSVTDVLEFSFLNSNYGHKFNDNVKAGTITVTDGQSQTATLTVKKVGDNKLEVTKVEKDVNSTFNFKSSTISITSTTGVVNQDQLAYNASASTGKTFNFVANIGSTTGIASAATADAIVIDGKTYALKTTSLLYKKDGTSVLGGTNIAAYINGAGTNAQVTISGDVLTELNTPAEVITAQVAAFKSAHATALALTVPTVAITDEAAVNNALTAHSQLVSGAKTALSAEKTLLDNLKNKIASLKAASADQALVNGELAKLTDIVLSADVVASNATVKAEVEKLVNLNTVTVAVSQVAATDKWTVTLTSKVAGATAVKTVTVSEVVSADQALVNAELAKVDSTLVLPSSATADEATILAAVGNKVNLNAVTVGVSQVGVTNVWTVTVTSKAAPTKTANKGVTVTVAP